LSECFVQYSYINLYGVREITLNILIKTLMHISEISVLLLIPLRFKTTKLKKKDLTEMNILKPKKLNLKENKIGEGHKIGYQIKSD
jgi:hypothetical protein